METLHFIPASVEDIAVIFEQARDLVDRFEDRSLIDYEHVLTWMRRKIETNISQYTCVWQDGKKAAYYRLCFDETGYELDDLYVLPDFRNHGIGSKILRRCFDETDQMIRLYVFKDNTGALRFYQKHGFSVLEQVSPTRMIMSRRP